MAGATSHRAHRRVLLAALLLAGGCQPVASLQGTARVPRWVQGFSLRNLHVYVDVAPDKLTLANLEGAGITSAPVGHEGGISLHRRYSAGFEPLIELSANDRDIDYHITVYEPSAVVELRFWIDADGDGRLGPGDLEGRPRGRVTTATDPGLFSCGTAGTVAEPVMWELRER